jgi:hypothetical protein
MELYFHFPVGYPGMMHKHRQKYVYLICMKDLIDSYMEKRSPVMEIL